MTRRRAIDWVILIIILLIFNLPFINVVMTSLKPNAVISKSPPPILFKPTIIHYRDIFTSPTFLFSKFLLNSLIIALVSAALTILICLPAAYSIVKIGVGSRILFSFVTNLRAIPLIVFASSVYILFKQLNLVDTRTGIIVIHILVNVPIALSLLSSFMQDVPKEIEESARLDGASELQVLFRIVTPMISSSVAAVFILSFIYSWNEFLFALILSIKKATTLTAGASLFVTAWGVQWGRIAAATTLAVIPPFVFAFYVQKYLVEAFSGGLKE
ncbi:hypothetical protein AS159_09350 [Thermotoga sp. Ku-13t]|uniref:carbohydrate ABC transporter permease n=1 Tax=Thermotoga sp. Ku-13t TaxID=1755813 RepID=UPI0016AFE806|nr:hypothetical protein AS159_09350 [Thermotoga sp. Ku-13t]